MHPAALQWAKQHVPELPRRVVDIGGMDVNCSLRNLYTWSEYVCVDIAPGPGVDVVMPFQEWAREQPPGSQDLVVCFEVLEHDRDWEGLVIAARHLLEPGGLFVGTCAAPGRTPHSAYGFPELPPDEYYENVSPASFCMVLSNVGFLTFTVDRARDGLDLRWVAQA